LHRGEIADTNSLMVAARCRQLGCVPLVSAVVPDDPDALAAELRRRAQEADLVLVIAGSSRGRGDHAGAVLAQVGGVAVAGVAVRPGHPALLGHAKRGQGTLEQGTRDQGTLEQGIRGGIAPVIGLPGYPLATAVIFELFAAPVLAAMQGWRRDGGTVGAVLDTNWSSPEGIEDWVPVTIARDGDGTVRATPGRRGAGSISQLARADAWWTVPASAGHVPAGTAIEIQPVAGDD
jgi:putative molybdopterin biosynthesis protein